MRHVLAELDVWETSILIFWHCKPSKAIKFIKREYRGVDQQSLKTLATYEDEHCRGVCIGSAKNGNSIIWIRDHEDEVEWLCVLVHEIVHAVSNFMEHWGIEKIKNTEEVLTSGVTTILRQVMRSNRRGKGKGKSAY